MIKKLKIKFVIINMSLIMFVLIVVLSIVGFSSYTSMENNIQDSLKIALEKDYSLYKEKFDLFDDSNSPDSSAKPYKPDDITNGDPSMDNHSEQQQPNTGSNSSDPWAVNKYEPSNYQPPKIGRKSNSKEFDLVQSVVVKTDSDNNIINTYENNASMSEDVLQEAVTQALDVNKMEGKLSDLELYFRIHTTSDGNYIAFADSSSIDDLLKRTILSYLFVIIASLIAFFIISIILAKMTVKPVEKAWTRQQQFIADASHELKTPLTVILANNNILKSHLSDSVASQKKWIASTEDEAQQMKKLVEDMLFLAKSDIVETSTCFSTINLSDLTTSSVLQFEPVAFEKNITIDSSIADDISIEGDETQLKQLIHILLDNACKYTANGGNVFLKIKRHQHQIHLSVNNSGNVISKEDIEHLFERFYRSDKARQREGGAGLGLSIAQSIAHAHGGVITVESNETSGTTFTVKLG